jgi:hypothetical protein
VAGAVICDSNGCGGGGGGASDVRGGGSKLQDRVVVAAGGGGQGEFGGCCSGGNVGGAGGGRTGATGGAGQGSGSAGGGGGGSGGDQKTGGSGGAGGRALTLAAPADKGHSVTAVLAGLLATVETQAAGVEAATTEVAEAVVGPMQSRKHIMSWTSVAGRLRATARSSFLGINH